MDIYHITIGQSLLLTQKYAVQSGPDEALIGDSHIDHAL